MFESAATRPTVSDERPHESPGSPSSRLSPPRSQRAHTPPLAMSKRKLEPQADAEDLSTLHAVYKEMSSAADAGNLPLLKAGHAKATGMRPVHASRKTLFLERQLCKRAAAHGRKACLLWLAQKYPVAGAVALAARNGHAHCLLALAPAAMLETCEYNEAVECALEDANVRVLHVLHTKFGRELPDDAVDFAITNHPNARDVVVYLHEAGFDLLTCHVEMAASANFLRGSGATFEYIIARGVATSHVGAPTTSTLTMAMKEPRFHAGVTFALRRGDPWDKTIAANRAFVREHIYIPKLRRFARLVQRCCRVWLAVYEETVEKTYAPCGAGAARAGASFAAAAEQQ